MTNFDIRTANQPASEGGNGYDEDQCPDCECCTRRQCDQRYCSGRCPCTTA